MTEDMRERFEKWALDHFAKNAKVKLIGVQRIGEHYMSTEVNKAWQAWQAALSSAGTSGTLFPLGSLMQVGSGTIADPYFVVVDRSICGGSLSGKGETTKKCPNCGGEIVSTVHGFYCPKPMCKWGWETEMDGSPLQPPSAPDRAEELAREIHCPNCINCIVKKGPANQCASEIERIASLLREAMVAAPPREEG